MCCHPRNIRDMMSDGLQTEGYRVESIARGMRGVITEDHL